ncbi:MAG: sigma-54 dependent transcriptional regulator [Candidatus Palauibacterales bacterium]|nr:sigma-54 dependent transcriptional regulator [Candidatus Palauibacterales bacterium]MDP2529163.1 sigma-54 dependent transcriptional regulator [Candidatus Palauibacterales bacterium]MDP2583959.1 sigma-54 dependent transcriptional regulator [Candidatus Palauibacterales bacterium]
MSDLPLVLVIDDEQSLVETLTVLLKREGFEVASALTGAEGLERFDERQPDLVLVDVRMPKMDGVEVLEAVRERSPTTPVVLMTAQASLQSAIRAVNLGATHYVQKPFENDELVAILRRSLDYGEVQRENLAIKEELRQTRARTGEVPRPIGESPKFTQAMELAESVAGSESTILIRGESGTGKEIFARYIHDLSPRSQGRFLSINCAALPESLLESELFGHVKGSFTGAVKDKEGLFVAAGGGSFFLDEVGEMAPSTQVKLLRVLQQREVVPVGATRPVPVDVRLIAATNRDLERDIETGRFRRDLYYRLNVIALELPPLRERTEDVPLLAEHFLERLAAEQRIERKKLSKDASELLAGYRWAGNVRELENVIERAVVLTDGATIKPEAFPERLREEPVEPLVRDEPPPNPTLEVIEQAYIAHVLKAEGGNKTRAAEVLGIDPSTLYRKINRYGIEA